jgi:hypothetical protein
MLFLGIRFGLTVAVFGTLSVAPALAVDESKPYALVAVTVIDPEKNQESLLGDGPPHAGDRLVMHLDANNEGEVLFVAFGRKSGRLAHGWRPVMANLKSWDEIQLPLQNEKWVWTKSAEPFEIFVVFAARNDPAVAAACQLVADLGDPMTGISSLDSKALSLREEIRKWQGKDELLAITPPSAPDAIGGPVRTIGDFPWRGSARKANFSAGRPAVLVFQTRY